MAKGGSDYKLWAYNPSLVAGTIAAVVFSLLTCFHSFSLFRNRTWFCIPFIIGSLFEAIGYAGRASAHNNTVSLIPYIIQSVLILIAPILFAASIYMILSRVIARTDTAPLSLIRPTFITKIFVAGDVLCFFIQAGGAGILVQGDDGKNVELGQYIILGGLILQIFIFLFFVLVAAIWQRRVEGLRAARTGGINWQKYIWLLYVASTCITLRNTYRVVEYAMGHDGYLFSHEWPLYVFDFTPMVIVLAVCSVWYDPNIKSSRKRTRSDIEIRQRS